MSTQNPAVPESSPVPEPKPPVTPTPAPTPAADPVKAAVAEALRVERETVAQKVEQAQREADEKAAKDKGEWEKVAKTNETRAIEAEHLLQIQRKDTTLTDYLAVHNPEYLARKRYIAPQIDPKLKGDELVKAVKDAVDDFVRDNPISIAPAGYGGAANRGPRIPVNRNNAAASNDRNTAQGYARSTYQGPPARRA